MQIHEDRAVFSRLKTALVGIPQARERCWGLERLPYNIKQSVKGDRVYKTNLPRICKYTRALGNDMTLKIDIFDATMRDTQWCYNSPSVEFINQGAEVGKLLFFARERTAVHKFRELIYFGLSFEFRRRR